VFRAFSVPSGKTAEGLPVGLQIYGPAFGEERVFAARPRFRAGRRSASVSRVAGPLLGGPPRLTDNEPQAPCSTTSIAPGISLKMPRRPRSGKKLANASAPRGAWSGRGKSSLHVIMVENPDDGSGGKNHKEAASARCRLWKRFPRFPVALVHVARPARRVAPFLWTTPAPR